MTEREAPVSQMIGMGASVGRSLGVWSERRRVLMERHEIGGSIVLMLLPMKVLKKQDDARDEKRPENLGIGASVEESKSADGEQGPLGDGGGGG